MKILSLFSPKGGVGKTTACLQLASQAAKEGLRVLVVDLDPLGSASHCLYPDEEATGKRKTLMKGGSSLKESIRKTRQPRLDLLPAGFGYRKLQEKDGNGKVFRKNLQPGIDRYDLVCLDGPATMSDFAKGILFACNLVLVPVVPAPLGRLSVELLENHEKALGIDRTRVRLFVSLFDRRRKLQQETFAWLSRRSDCLETVIPYRSAIERSSAGVPLGKAIVQIYERLWQEVRNELWKH